MDHTRVKYKVYPEHGVVVATIDGCTWDAIEYFQKQFVKQATAQIDVTHEWDFNEKGAKMPQSFKATARCQGDDIFNEEVGKRIALSKLSKKHHNALCKRIAYINKSLIKATKLCEEYLKKLPK